MSKFSNSISLLLSAFSISYLLAFSAPQAAAQYVTSLGQAPSQVRLCPNRKCLQIFEHSFVRGKKIVIYEKKNGWVRLSGTIAPEKLQAKFAGEKLPANAAFWIPSADLPPITAIQFHSEEEKPETDKKPKPVVFAKLPKIAPLPTPRPAQQVALKEEPQTPPNVPIAKPAVVAKKPESKTKEPEIKKDASPSVDQDKKAKIQQAAVETKTEPEVETDSFGNPIVKLPSKLTKELKDKRLAKLPRKPNRDLDLKSVITIRYHGLRLLNNGSCKAIKEGGKSLSLADWIYVICKNDGQYRQFPVE